MNIGKKTSCWVGVVYKPRGVGTGDSATLTAGDERGAVAKVRISGSSAVPSPGHVYWVGAGDLTGDGTVNEILRGGGVVSTLAGGSVLRELGGLGRYERPLGRRVVRNGE